MYVSGPALAAAWRTLLAWVSATSGIDLARLAYSIESSHSSYNAPRHHFLGYRTAARPAFGEATPARFEVFRERPRAAEVAGYPLLA